MWPNRTLHWLSSANSHCVKSVRIQSYSGLHFSHIFPHSDWIRSDTEYLSVFSSNAAKCGKNADQNNSKYGHFLYSVSNRFEKKIFDFVHSIFCWKCVDIAEADSEPSQVSQMVHFSKIETAFSLFLQKTSILGWWSCIWIHLLICDMIFNLGPFNPSQSRKTNHRQWGCVVCR